MNQQTKHLSYTKNYEIDHRKFNIRIILSQMKLSKPKDSLQNQNTSDALSNEMIPKLPLQHNFHSSQNDDKGPSKNKNKKMHSTSKIHRGISVEISPDSSGYHKVHQVLTKIKYQ